LHRQMLEVLGIQDADKIVRLGDDIDPADPATENMKVLKQEPVKAFMYQDHEAHIKSHMAMMEDPKIRKLIGQSPFAQVIQANLTEHITEHVALQYRKEVEKQMGVSLPDPESPLPEDIERDLAPVIARAAEKVLQKDKREAAQEQAAEQQKDPLTVIQQKEMALKEAEFEHKKQMDLAKLQAEMQNKQATRDLEEERLASQERQEGARLGVRIATEKDKLERKDQVEGAKLGVEIAKSIADNTNQ